MDTGRYPGGYESDKGSKKILEVYSGDPKLWTDLVDAATDKVRDEGGENTVKHWIGEYSEAKVRSEIERSTCSGWSRSNSRYDSSRSSLYKHRSGERTS